jgi:uncharacterized protein YegP (UPF0339 family)
MTAKFEIMKSSDGKEFYWHFKSANGEIVAVSQQYKTKQACQKGIDAIRSDSKNATIHDLTETPKA